MSWSAWGEVNLLLVGFARGGPGEGSDFETLGQYADSSVVVVEGFKAVATLVGEEKEPPVFEARGFHVLGKGSEVVERLAHVARLKSEENAKVIGETHHTRPPFLAELASRRRLSMS